MTKEADPIDQAADNQLLIEEYAVQNIRAEAQHPIPLSDNCYYCGEDTLNGARWCSSYCRDLWEKNSKSIDK
jgi:hypothetical protein